MPLRQHLRPQQQLRSTSTLPSEGGSAARQLLTQELLQALSTAAKVAPLRGHAVAAERRGEPGWRHGGRLNRRGLRIADASLRTSEWRMWTTTLGNRSYFLVFVPTIREIRDFNREKYGTDRESVTMYRASRAGPSESIEHRRGILAMAAERRIAAASVTASTSASDEPRQPSQQVDRQMPQHPDAAKPKPAAALAGASQWKSRKPVAQQAAKNHTCARTGVAARLSGLPLQQLGRLAKATVQTTDRTAAAESEGQDSDMTARLAVVEAKYRRRRAQLIVSSRPAAVRRLLAAADEVQ
eukprot:SAG31_NODE_1379_length_8582_cov_17.482848_4_plen_298_part_00